MSEHVSATFDARPIRTATRRVLPEWIDYNGHMNVAYYTMAFDAAIDEVYERLGIGETLVRSRNMGPMALQSQVHYLGELLEGDAFATDFLLLDWDAKRVHSISTMVALGEDGSERVAATYETLSLNVDLAARRSAPYPDEAQTLIRALGEAQAGLPRPPQVGRTIAIRRA
jgi:acyl-CoA thioester hydrolase